MSPGRRWVVPACWDRLGGGWRKGIEEARMAHRRPNEGMVASWGLARGLGPVPGAEREVEWDDEVLSESLFGIVVWWLV